jgi:hypothetical protein
VLGRIVALVLIHANTFAFDIPREMEAYERAAGKAQ